MRNRFWGGANSVRGYKPTGLGREFGGKNQLLTTVEYQHLLLDIRELTVFGLSLTMGLELAAFVDTGTTWDEPNEFGDDRRYSSPLETQPEHPHSPARCGFHPGFAVRSGGFRFGAGEGTRPFRTSTQRRSPR